jgi:N-acetylmuramoyl-L-alanine amidase/peptidoglycan/xylan/chitin deacetylase (PgdA/CDA1 family)
MSLCSRPFLALACVLVAVIALAACGHGANPSAVRIDRLGGESGSSATPHAPLVVFIDPGHGGRDPGWGSSYILPGVPLEKDLTLDLAKRTAAYLENAGYRVVLSRTTDTDVNEPERDINGDGVKDIVDELQARADEANASGAAVLLSIHFNGMPGTNLGGSLVEYNDKREFSDQNKRLAELVQQSQLDALASVGYHPRDWGALSEEVINSPKQSELDTGYNWNTLIGPAGPYRPRPTKMPGAIAEPLFLTNPAEAQLAEREDVRDALAKGYARAIQQFLGGAGDAPSPAAGAPSATPTPAGGGRAAASPAATDGPAKLIDRVQTDRKVIALTFDAGAGTGYAEAILNTLDRKGVKATFGLTGKWCEENLDLARRIGADGHAVINHTYDHASWTGLSTESKPLTEAQRRDEVERGERAIEAATGINAKPYFRSPYGDQDAGVQRDLGAFGYRYNVLWTWDSGGWNGAQVNDIVSRGLRAAAPGAIFIFHVGDLPDALALEPLIDGLTAQGYSFVTVPDLLSQG